MVLKAFSLKTGNEIRGTLSPVIFIILLTFPTSIIKAKTKQKKTRKERRKKERNFSRVGNEKTKHIHSLYDNTLQI